MCFHTQHNFSKKQLEQSLNASFNGSTLFSPIAHANGFSHPSLPIIVDSQPENITISNWGLIPHWAKDDQIKKYTLNARVETLHEKPSFRDVIQQRCIVPVSGYFEWQWQDPKGKQKQKYLLKDENESIFCLGGIYSYWNSPQTSSHLSTFTLITTEANPFVAKIHNHGCRMPIAFSIKDINKWFSEEKMTNFLQHNTFNLTAEKA